MILDNCKFLQLVNQDLISCCLKTYCDTLLFYYLGHLAVSNVNGAISEIGVGGSTYALTELSEQQSRDFFVFDQDDERLKYFGSTKHWPSAKSVLRQIDSNMLHCHQWPKFAYCHVDGSKNFDTAVSDLKFYLDNLSTNGLICQDDYSNSKWPTVTDAVKYLEHQGQLQVIMVGDSSAWLTKPEYYDFWIGLFESDSEFKILAKVCNLVESTKLSKYPKYFFINSRLNDAVLDDLDSDALEYFQKLLNWSEKSQPSNRREYLRMPYQSQCKIGSALTSNFEGYKITNVYNSIKGINWPQEPPVTLEDINQLQQWIKDEIKEVHKIDLYEKVVKRNAKSFQDE
jgi:hypothetical protein